MALNKGQKQVVHCNIKQPVIVVAGPGTGKTRILVERVRFLHDNKSADVKGIKLLAFTKAAASEMQSRIDEYLPSLSYRTASTFHRWCFSLLRRIPEYDGYKVMKPNKQERFIGKFLAAAQLECNMTPKDFSSLVSYALNSGTAIKDALNKAFPNDADSLYLVYRQYKYIKKTTQNLDFTDLITIVNKHLDNCKFSQKVAKEFPHLLLDEAQDLSTVQWNIIQKLSECGTTIMCVGDPAQAIFGFSGADVTWFNYFENKFKDAQRFEIGINYRSTTDIVTLSNWVRKSINENFTDVVACNSNLSLPRLVEFDKFLEVTDWIVKDIQRKGACTEDASIAIIYRNKREGKVIGKRLKEAGVPMVSKKSKMGVKLTTAHKAKGREWKCCYVIDPRFLSFHTNDKTTEKCLLYVALTRAEKELIICVSKNRKKVPYSDYTTGERYLLDDLPSNRYQFKRP